MSIVTLLVVLLIIAFIGGTVPFGGPVPAPGTPPRDYWHGYGFGPIVPGGIGLIVLVLVILLLLGRV